MGTPDADEMDRFGVEPATGEEGNPAATAPGTTRGGDAGGTPSGAGPAVGAGADTGPAARSGDLRPAAAESRGISDTEITIGLVYTEDADQVREGLGAAGFTEGDPRRNFETLIAWFNERGGLAGRQIKPVYHQFRAASGTPASVQQEEACVTHTQDNEVFAVLIQALTEEYMACMHRHPVGVVGSPIVSNTVDDGVYERFPRWLDVSANNLSRAAALNPRGQNELGFFQPESPARPVRIGLMTYDLPRFRRALEEHLVPSLRQVGHEAAETVYVKAPDTVAGIGETSAEISNAILRFRTADVTHVMILDTGLGLTFLFMNQAEQQAYRPFYGLDSHNGGQVLIDTGIVPGEQLRKATLTGWFDYFDVAEEQVQAVPARQQCEEIYAEQGIQFADNVARATGWLHCDLFFFAREAIDATSGPLSADTFVQGAARLGSGYQSAALGPTTFSANKRYGVSRYRLARYVEDCHCFRYVSQWRPMP